MIAPSGDRECRSQAVAMVLGAARLDADATFS
jgi:hypothetical protein